MLKRIKLTQHTEKKQMLLMNVGSAWTLKRKKRTRELKFMQIENYCCCDGWSNLSFKF